MSEVITHLDQCISTLEIIADDLEDMGQIVNAEHLDFIIQDLKFEREYTNEFLFIDNRKANLK